MPWRATVGVTVTVKTLLPMAFGTTISLEILATATEPRLMAKRPIASTVISGEDMVLTGPQEGIPDDCDIIENEEWQRRPR
jgi:hypothetical protein